MIYAILASIINAVDLIVTKQFFNVFKNLKYTTFIIWLFVWIIIIGSLTAPWLIQIDSAASSLYYLVLLLTLAIIAANYNLLYYFGLRYEKVSEIEPFLLLEPLATILIASVFYADERIWQVYIAGFVAGGFLAWSHIKKRHIKLGKPLLAILGYAVLVGLEAVVVRQLLVVYSPIALYVARAMMVALILWIIEKGQIRKISLKQIPYFILLAITAIGSQTLIYYAYRIQGINLTSLALMLSPVLIYLLSVSVLKEKLNWKNLVTSVIVVVLIIWVTLIR